MGVEEVAGLPVDKIFLIMLTCLHSVNVLHHLNIVHGDLKPDNILLKKTETESYAAKIIDFDDSYESNNPPDPEVLVGDQVYFSPEVEEYVTTCDKKLARTLTTKADVFSLGAIFCQYSTGRLPHYDERRFKSIAASVAAGERVELPRLGVGEEVRTLIASMLQLNPVNRPAALEAFSIVKRRYHETREEVPDRVPSLPGKLKGKGLGGREHTGRLEGATGGELELKGKKAAPDRKDEAAKRSPRVKGKGLSG